MNVKKHEKEYIHIKKDILFLFLKNIPLFILGIGYMILPFLENQEVVKEVINNSGVLSTMVGVLFLTGIFITGKGMYNLIYYFGRELL